VTDSNKVIKDFGEEWKRFNFLEPAKLQTLKAQFEMYISPLPEETITSKNLVIADFGAGSGRWSHFLKEYASKLYVVEPSKKAFEVAASRFHDDKNVLLLNESIEENSVPDSSLDLAVSLGVMHHIENTQMAISQVALKIKPNGLFLGYLYYALENKPLAYRVVWKTSNGFRIVISRMPKAIKQVTADLIAVLVYFPFARFAKLLSRLNLSSSNVPLHHYKNLSFHVMRNDALDRFGTTLEQRFTQEQIRQMLERAGFESGSIKFSESEPYWTFSARKAIA
jgi:SAM-dependent methyltransferase